VERGYLRKNPIKNVSDKQLKSKKYVSPKTNIAVSTLQKYNER